MFTTKKSNLLASKPATAPQTTVTSVKAATANPFILAAQGKQLQTTSGNGATKLTTSGNPFVDQFSAVARYRNPRSFQEISADMLTLWQKNPYMTLLFVFYLRTITRITSLFNGEKTSVPQRGQGLKHESIFRMLWLHVNAPDTFWKNIPYFIAVGSWKDIITMLSYDLQWNGWNGRVLDWNKFSQLILAGLENPTQNNLLKKYLPQIKANSKCTTLESQADNIIAKWICSLCFGGKTQEDNYKNYRAYRKLKTSGTAHEWQKLISRHQMLKIDFKTIHGRALSLLVSGKFLKNNHLEAKYAAWIAQQPVAKFTGYVYELVSNIKPSMQIYQKDTINKQFLELVETAKKGLSNTGLRPISVLDASSSMNSHMYIGGGKVGPMRSIEVAMSSLIFFDAMIDEKSPFKNHYLQFANTTQMNNLIGDNFVDRYLTSPRIGYGGTNFQSVFDFFADFKRKNPLVDESLIPNFIVCWSDGEFNSVSSSLTTNVQAGRKKLAKAGYSKEYCDSFGICFVDLPNTFYSHCPTQKFETFANAKNCFYFSGYDLAPLAFLFGVSTSKIIPQTAEELFDIAMDQEIFKKLSL